MAMRDLLNMILQLDQLNIQQQNADLEGQKARAGYLNSFISNLQYAESPEQLTAMQRTYNKEFGLPMETLVEASANYVPTVAGQQARSVYAHRKRVRGTSAEANLDQTTAYSTLTGTGEATAARERADALAIQNPSMWSGAVPRASLFNRIGFNPGQFALSEAIGALPPSTLNQAAQIETRTAIDPATQAGLGLQAQGQVLNRDVAQGQLNLGYQGLQQRKREAAQSYNLGLLPFLAAKAGAGGAAGGLNFDDELAKDKFIFQLLEQGQKGGSTKATQSALDNLIRKWGATALQGTAPDARFNSNFWNKTLPIPGLAR